MHTTARRHFARCGDVEAVFHDACNDHPNRLSKHHGSPAGGAQNAGEIREREQGQCVGACLYTVKRNYIVYESAAKLLSGDVIRPRIIIGGGSGAAVLGGFTGVVVVGFIGAVLDASL
jgi:hypothetical protein